MSHSTYVSKTYMNIWETDGTSVKKYNAQESLE